MSGRNGRLLSARERKRQSRFALEMVRRLTEIRSGGDRGTWRLFSDLYEHRSKAGTRKKPTIAGGGEGSRSVPKDMGLLKSKDNLLLKKRELGR